MTFNKMKSKLQSRKLSLHVRMRLFNCYITSIFLYNSELWVLTKRLENEIDIFQRNLLRKILNIYYPYVITNVDLYRRTKEKLWSSNIKTRRLRWTGHLLRLNEQTPAYSAFNESRKINLRQGQGNRLTWNKMIEKDLNELDTNISLKNTNIKLLA